MDTLLKRAHLDLALKHLQQFETTTEELDQWRTLRANLSFQHEGETVAEMLDRRSEEILLNRYEAEEFIEQLKEMAINL